MNVLASALPYIPAPHAATRPAGLVSGVSVSGTRRQHRPRDFGVGYGNSSGYASGKRYADNWGNARFQCG